MFGVVLHVAPPGQLAFKAWKTFGRAKGMFPDPERDAFHAAMQAVGRTLAAQARQLAEVGGLPGAGNAVSVARQAMPADDSTLQWSEIGSGVTDDLSKALDKLYARMATRYDTHTTPRKTDDDVWRPVREKLGQLGVPIHLEEKVVTGATEEIAFKHAWKNSKWHAYEPVSLDLADGGRYQRQGTALADGAREELKLHFIVGALQNPALRPAYQNALTILRQADFSPAVFEDTEVDTVVAEIEDEVRAHARQRG